MKCEKWETWIVGFKPFVLKMTSKFTWLRVNQRPVGIWTLILVFILYGWDAKKIQEINQSVIDLFLFMNVIYVHLET